MTEREHDASTYDRTWTVVEDYDRSRENPVAGERGEELRVGRSDDWAGHAWRWCTDSRGRQGWVAEEALDVRDGHAVLCRDFDAIELTVSKGERVVGSDVMAGWLWATDAGGTSGWIPLEVVEEN